MTTDSTPTTPALNAGDFSVTVTNNGTGILETIQCGALTITRKHGTVVAFVDRKGFPRVRRQSQDLNELIDAIVYGSGRAAPVFETKIEEASGPEADRISKANIVRTAASV